MGFSPPSIFFGVLESSLQLVFTVLIIISWTPYNMHTLTNFFVVGLVTLYFLSWVLEMEGRGYC